MSVIVSVIAELAFSVRFFYSKILQNYSISHLVNEKVRVREAQLRAHVVRLVTNQDTNEDKKLNY